MYTTTPRATAIALLRTGVSNADVARALHVPAGTIGYWKHVERRKDPADLPIKPKPQCPRCVASPLDNAAYAYLLGLYLGDGHISRARSHRVWSLSIACADAWPGLVEAADQALVAVMPSSRVCRVQYQGCKEVKSYSKHWPCLFPQHGPGRKHERKIELAGWQETIVAEYPGEFVRGLIHSDGCRVTNWTTRRVAGELKRYEYPRYLFVNESVDIRELYTGSLDVLGVAWRHSKRNTVSVARREAVSTLDQYVGPKY